VDVEYFRDSLGRVQTLSAELAPDTPRIQSSMMLAIQTDEIHGPDQKRLLHRLPRFSNLAFFGHGRLLLSGHWLTSYTTTTMSSPSLSTNNIIDEVNPYESRPDLSPAEANLLWEYAKTAALIKDVRMQFHGVPLPFNCAHRHPYGMISS
jgi:hypothetical protein